MNRQIERERKREKLQHFKSREMLKYKEEEEEEAVHEWN